ncbi:MFS transporter [Allonocardiopsis opalescens]|uniref:Putative MFS family arabinose efflux permease n=1 Tax=Allonocardiopsis opalescens TaxID=1144618 RepID=A0A2T0PTA5_9ACTN|nr:MFS transporter [Allonocardiopsis opalescens]PRX92132.1 putative MFS family arabinose efflux permease [Allonocardiopsis opalescens]
MTETPTPPRTAPFASTAAFTAVASVVLLSQLYGSIALFAQISADLHVDTAAVGLLQSAFGVAYAAGFILWGPAVDRFGPRRTMLAGLLGLAAMTALAASAASFGWLIAARVGQGLAAAAFAPAAFAYLGTRLAPPRRVAAVTILTSSFLASAVIGQLLAQLAVDHASWRWFFGLSAAALLAVAAAAAAVVLPAPAPGSGGARPLAALWTLLRRGPVLLLLVATSAVLGPFIALYTAAGASGSFPAHELTAMRASALPALVWAAFATPVLGRIPARVRLVGAFAVAAGACAALAGPADGRTAVTVCLFAIAAAVSVAAPAMIETLSGHAPELRGTVTALYTFWLFLGAALSPLLVTAAAASLPATATASAAALAAGALLTLAARAAPARG